MPLPPAQWPISGWSRRWRPGYDQSQGCSRALEPVIYNDRGSPQSLGFLAGDVRVRISRMDTFSPLLPSAALGQGHPETGGSRHRMSR